MPPKVNIEKNQRFGRWTVLYESKTKKRNRPSYFCRCDCGTERDVQGNGLRNGTSKSCGCLKRDNLSKRETEHGLSKHLLYWIWKGMMNRCENKKNKNYKNYGERGILVCNDWHDYLIFFHWALKNGWAKGLSIERINNDGNYEPNNCKFATHKEQARNRRVSKKYLFYGEFWHVGEIAEIFFKKPEFILNRIYKGWSIYEAVFGRVKSRSIWD